MKAITECAAASLPVLANCLYEVPHHSEWPKKLEKESKYSDLRGAYGLHGEKDKHSDSWRHKENTTANFLAQGRR